MYEFGSTLSSARLCFSLYARTLTCPGIPSMVWKQFCVMVAVSTWLWKHTLSSWYIRRQAWARTIFLQSSRENHRCLLEMERYTRSVRLQFERNPICTLGSTTEMSQMECGHRGNFSMSSEWVCWLDNQWVAFSHSPRPCEKTVHMCCMARAAFQTSHPRSMHICTMVLTSWFCKYSYAHFAVSSSRTGTVVSLVGQSDNYSQQEELESVGELSQVCSQIVLKCLYLARCGRPDILWSVNKLARAVTQIGKSLWQSLCSFDFIHSSLKWISTILSCGYHCWALSTGFIPRIRLCWRPWGLEMNVRRSLMYFRKSNVCSHKLDVQETNVSISQFYRVWNHFLGCWTANVWTTCSWSLRHSDWSSTFNQQQCPTQTFEHSGNWLYASFQSQDAENQMNAKGWAIVCCGLCTHHHTFFSGRVSVVHFWRQRSGDQHDYQKTKSNNETRVQNPESCAWMVVRQNQRGTEDPNQRFGHQEPTCWHVN